MADNPMLDEAWRFHRSGEHDRAAELYQSVLLHQPQNFDALYLLGLLHGQNGRFEEAQSFTEQALLLNPMSADALFLRSYALERLRRDDEALVCLNRVLAFNPGMKEALLNRASLLFRLGLNAAAAADYEQLLAVNPDYPFMRGYLWSARLQDCDWRKFDGEQAAIIAGLEGSKKIVTPFHAKTLLLSPSQELKCAQIFIAQEATGPPLWQGERYAHDRIKIAYISGEFRAHPLALLIAGVFEHHDKSRFETIGVSFGPDAQSDIRSRIVSGLERFVDVGSSSDLESAALLKQMEIDIAVDLTGFIDGCRPAILARRPAPVQVNFLGFPGTMGGGQIDYILADRVIVPDAERRFYSEEIVYLPDTYQPNDSKRQVAAYTPTRAEIGLRDDAFVFCCLNNNYKITPQIFDIWMRLLCDVEGSLLWLLEGSAAASQNFRTEALARGIAPNRLVFAPRIPTPEHLARQRLADLFLDTSPCNAHTTASDALFMGLPVVTVLGGTFAGRVAASLLGAITMPELIASSLAEYENLALRLAREPARLAGLREKLARNRETAALFDTALFTRNLEAAYIQMWERTQRGEPPAHFSVMPEV